jgi:DNA-binding transcriptional ArsR family regulator
MRPSQLRLRIAQLELELARLKALLATTAYLNPERQLAFLATRQKVLAAFAKPITPSAALKASRLTRQSFTRHFRKLRAAGLIAPASSLHPDRFLAHPAKLCLPDPSRIPSRIS